MPPIIGGALLVCHPLGSCVQHFAVTYWFNARPNFPNVILKVKKDMTPYPLISPKNRLTMFLEITCTCMKTRQFLRISRCYEVKSGVGSTTAWDERKRLWGFITRPSYHRRNYCGGLRSTELECVFGFVCVCVCRQAR